MFSVYTYSLATTLLIGTLINLLFYYLYRHIPAILSDLSKSLLFPSEILAILKVKFGGYVEKTKKSSLDKLAVELNDIDF